MEDEEAPPRDGMERRVGGSAIVDVMESCPAVASKSARLVIFVNLYTGAECEFCFV